MDYLRGQMRRLKTLLRPAEELEKKREVTKLEAYLVQVYRVLSWEDARLTLNCFLVLNVLFWLVMLLELKPLGLFFLFATIFVAADSFLERKGPLEVDERHAEACDRLREDFMHVVSILKTLRTNNHGQFTFIWAVLCVFLIVVARTVNQKLLSWLAFWAIFLVPWLVSRMSPCYVANIKKFFRLITSDLGDLDENDLIPVYLEGDERDPDLDSLLTDRTADSVTNSFVSGLNSMPSYLDAEDKESLEEDDFLPLTSGQSAISITPGDLSSDSDSEHKLGHFKVAHFNGDSSSEEELYPKNTTLPWITEVDAKDKAEKIYENVMSVAYAGTNFVSQVIKGTVAPQREVTDGSSSDSDFEIIDPGEVPQQ